jgi:AraC-like DNA-binding protein
MSLPKIIIEEDDVKQIGELEEPLKKCMEEERMFIKSDLTIYDVAKKIDSTTRKVSNCINDCFGSNFSEWVNRYRVEEVKSRFEDNATDLLTIEAIGQESGFKSRSALYTAFTKFTGHSPAKFRKIDLS